MDATIFRYYFTRKLCSTVDASDERKYCTVALISRVSQSEVDFLESHEHTSDKKTRYKESNILFLNVPSISIIIIFNASIWSNSAQSQNDLLILVLFHQSFTFFYGSRLFQNLSPVINFGISSAHVPQRLL
uniref:Uncharacterized protein n=1 Tax=Glossina austeni TaxID=7395 RepID=A0A1A9UKW8_GLOAU